MSDNHQFIEFSDNVYTKYKKTINGGVSGKRLNPHDPKQRLDFVLQSHHRNYNADTNTVTFDYETDVVEIYSPEEDKLFRIVNRTLFQRGILVPYEEGREEVDLSNALSDSDITELAQTKNLFTFKKRVKQLNTHNLTRLLDVVKSENRPYSFISAVQELL